MSSCIHDRELLSPVIKRLEDRITKATIASITAGDRQLFVTVDDPTYGSLAGISLRPPGTIPRVKGEPVATVLSTVEEWHEEKTQPVQRAVGMATLNALSSPLMNWIPGDPIEEKSGNAEIIVTVGLFGPAIEKWTDQEIRVIEREPVDGDALPAHISLFTPDESVTAFDGADLCFITGSTLVYGGLSAYLAALPEKDRPTVVLIGATASFLPHGVFAAGVDVLAGIQIVDRVAVQQGIAAGACGSDLHTNGLEKVYWQAGSSTHEKPVNAREK